MDKLNKKTFLLASGRMETERFGPLDVLSALAWGLCAGVLLGACI